MTMTLIADAPVDVDAEGFLTDPEQWNEQIAAGDRRRERHPRADRPPLARRPLHARALPRDRHRALDPLARQGIRRPDQGALPALPQGARPSSPPRSAASPSPRAASRKEHDDDRAARTTADRRRRAEDDREGRDRDLQGLARGHLPRPDHGQRRPHGGHRGRPLLHLLRPRRDPQGPLREDQGRDRRQPRHAHADLARRAPRLLRARHQDDEAADGEDRHPADPRVHRARRRLRRPPLRLQGDASTCSG